MMWRRERTLMRPDVEPAARAPALLIGLVSLWIATLANLPLWQELSRLGLAAGAAGVLLMAGLGVAIFGALVALLGLLSWRWTLKPMSVFLLLAAAVGAHYMLAYRVVIDPTMMVNVVQTNVTEAADLLTWRMLITVLLLGGLPAALVLWMPVHHRPWPQRLWRNAGLLLAGLALVVAGVMASFQPLSSTMRNHKQVRYLINPLNSLYAVGHVAAAPLRRVDNRLRPVGEDARLTALPSGAAKPPLVVLVVGETARAANFSLNGYARDTTPELAREGVLSFRNAWSCGTSTAASLPCMFSNLGREGWADRSGPHENLLDVLQRAGLAVLWLDNQSGCKGVCDRVPNEHTEDTQMPELCTGGECLDEALLKGLDARLARLPAERRARGTVLVMHPMGSHGPAYFKRSPPAFKRFLPECTTATLQACDRQAVVNAYDNSIAYTDHVVASVIGWLKGQSASHDTALLYVSDHGESLGENGLYLHGLPYAIAPDVQKQVPWLTWFSPGFMQRQGLDPVCLKTRVDAPLSHDNLFHSMLGLLDVQTSARLPALDAYASCRAPGA